LSLKDQGLWLRQNAGRIGLWILLVAAAYLYYRNLSGVIYLTEDEARPFALFQTGPLLCLVCKPVYDFFREQSAVFYLVSTLGLVSVYFFYKICCFFLDEKSTLVALFFYAFYPLRYDYIRSLYPGTFVEFFFLAALLCALIGILRGRVLFFVVSGFLCASAMFAHYFAYEMVFGVFAGSVYLLWTKNPEKRGRALSVFVLLFLGGIALGYFVLNQWLLAKGYNYWERFLAMRGTEQFYATHGRNHMLVFLGGEFRRIVALGPAIILFVLVSIGACATSAFAAIKERFKELRFFFVVWGGGALFFTVVAFFLHTVEERHYVWLGGLVAVCLAFIAREIARSPRSVLKGLGAIAMGAFAVFFLVQDAAASQEVFKMKTITQWLEENGIARHQVLTMWWQIDDGRDNLPSNRIPVNRMTDGKYPASLWYLDNPRFYVNWKQTLFGYRSGFRFLMTSGIETHVRTATDEKVLQSFKPLMSWAHPYSAFRHRFFYEPDTNYRIEIYDLKEIFKKII